MKIKGIGFIKAVGLNGGSAVFTQGATLLLTLTLSNLFGPEGLARFFVTQNTVNTLALLTQMGLAYTAMTFAARYHVQNAPYAKAIIVFCQSWVFGVSTLVAAALALASGWIAARIYGDGGLAGFVLLACIATPFTAIALVQLNVLNGLEHYRSIFASAAAAAILLFATTAAGGFGWGPWGAAVGFTLSTVARAMILQWCISYHQRQVQKMHVEQSEIWQRIRRFAIPAGLAGLTLTPTTWLANALLLNHSGLQEMGLFLAALTIRSAVFFVPQQIGSTFLPRYIRQSQSDPGSASRNFWHVMLAMIGLSATMTLLSVLAGGSILALFGAEFSQAKTILQLLMLAVVFETASLAFTNKLAAEERMWTMLLAYTWPKDLLLLLVAYLAIPHWHGIGLALAYLASVIYGLLAYLIIAKS
jgi:O-antigen/teichoic acid export membrane protein